MIAWAIVLGIWIVIAILLTIADRRRARWPRHDTAQLQAYARDHGVDVREGEDSDTLRARVRTSLQWPPAARGRAAGTMPPK